MPSLSTIPSSLSTGVEDPMDAPLTADEQAQMAELISQMSSAAGTAATGTAPPAAAAAASILPEAGMVIKTRTKSGDKIFINLCHSSQMIEARSVTDEEICTIIESEDASSFRLPLSLAAPHAETDKSNSGCTVYDALLGTQTYERARKSPIYMEFVLEMTMQWIEQKHDCLLDRNYKTLLNKKAFGTLSMHHVNVNKSAKKKIEPLIVMQEQEQEQEGTNKDDGVDTNSNKIVPSYTMQWEPEDEPSFLVVEISLPGVCDFNGSGAYVDVGAHRIKLETRNNPDDCSAGYMLDLHLQHRVDPNDGGAQYNRNSKTLTLTLPVVVSA